MTTFGELINKANDQDKKDIRDVMSAFLKKTEKDIITPEIILESENELDRLRGSTPMSQGDFSSIQSWKIKHKVFLDHVNKNGGRRKRRKRTRKRRKKKRKRTRRKRKRTRRKRKRTK